MWARIDALAAQYQPAPPVAELQPAPGLPDDPDQRIADYIMAAAGKNPKAVTVRGIAKKLAIPKSTVERSRPWREFADWRAENKTGEVHARRLTERMLATIAAPPSREEELARYTAEQVADDESASW